jgi:hypothetical protein
MDRRLRFGLERMSGSKITTLSTDSRFEKTFVWDSHWK